jgi:hypothetical protein
MESFSREAEKPRKKVIGPNFSRRGKEWRLSAEKVRLLFEAMGRR